MQRLHIIAQGRVASSKTSVSGRSSTCCECSGESVADCQSSMVGHFLRPGGDRGCRIAFISRRDFQAYCMEHPEVALKVLQVVGARLRRLVGIIEELSFTTIRNDSYRHCSTCPKRGQAEFSRSSFTAGNPQETRQSAWNGTRTGSRNLMRLQAEGLLDVDARQIVVKDLDGLKALLEATFRLPDFK